MKFKVGDSVRFTDNLYNCGNKWFTHERQAKITKVHNSLEIGEWLTVKFSPPLKVRHGGEYTQTLLLYISSPEWMEKVVPIKTKILIFD